MKKLFTLIALFATSMPLFAQDFVANGMTFNILSAEDKTVALNSIITQTVTTIEIPAQVTSSDDNETYTVTEVGNMAFWGLSSLKSISLPSTITKIGNNAFLNCSSLTSINIPENVTYIDYEAFKKCTALTSVEVPNNVTYLGNGAFSGCSKLTTVILPEGITSIGDNTFYNCYELKSVEIPNGVTSIGKQAFFQCYNALKSIVIPNSVTSIGEKAFQYCEVLNELTIGSNVASIGSNAFSGCKALTTITSLIPADKLFTVGGTVFNGVNKDTCILKVLFGAKDTYAATEGWSAFINIEELSEDYSGVGAINLGNEPVDAVYYDLYGRRVANPSNGIFIVNGKKVYIK